MPHRTRVVIVGAGFGGLETARRLAGEGLDVLLVDRHNYHTFFPLLYQVGAAEIDASEIAYPVRRIVRRWEGVRFRMAEARKLDPTSRTVSLAPPGDGDAAPEVVPFDHLVLAAGSDAHFFGVPGAAEHAFPLRQVEHGLALRNHVLGRFERAEALTDPAARVAALTFVIVGGGATGVEYAGALAELVYRPLLRDHRGIRREEPRIVLLEAGEGLLPGVPERLGAYAARRLDRMDVEVRTGATVRRVGPREVEIEGGETLVAETVVWTAGVRGAGLAERWGLPVDRQGRVRVAPTLELAEAEGVWVLGDLAAPTGEDPPPMVAPVAIQQGAHVARSILRRVRAAEPEPFRYRDPGLLATIGRNAAVARLFGRTFTGYPAWALWAGVHIARLIGFRNRLVVLVSWAWDYVTFERVVRLILPLREAARLEERGRSSAPPSRP
ncbi:MAG: NAD(P)/FAD-dependent oxidoreductase [Candidatus Palauibacterales bacterium]|nr:NAD(P)/FAD-dependent oxidoreductase [Candidatus Palauibacterales bacterium]MDP2584549.1 NAD(P)/FAD-dependent oxidoreductase [Candidatus Palauibacterales bacterium]